MAREFRDREKARMPPINGVDNSGRVSGAGGGEPPRTFSVEVPSMRPSREQVTEAFYRYFGFTRADLPFLRRHFNGTDPFAYFARTLEYNPRSTYTAADGQTMTRISLSAKDYEMMRRDRKS